MDNYNLKFNESGTLKWNRQYEVLEGKSFKLEIVASPDGAVDPVLSVGLTCLDSSGAFLGFEPCLWDEHTFSTANESGTVEVLKSTLPVGTQFIQLTFISHNAAEGLIHYLSIVENTLEANSRTFRDEAVSAREEAGQILSDTVVVQGIVTEAATSAANSATAAQTAVTTAQASADAAGNSASITQTNLLEVESYVEDAEAAATASAGSAATAATRATEAEQFATASESSSLAADTARAQAEASETAAVAAFNSADEARVAAETAEGVAVAAQNAAGDSATASAGHASSAQASADDAEQFSIASNSSATAAATSETNAGTSASQSSAASNAAAAARDQAQTHAAAAAGSASTSSTQASLADDARVAAEQARDTVINTADGLEARVSTVEGAVADAGGLESWFENRTSVAGVQGTFIEARTRLANDTVTSNVSIGAREIILQNYTNGSWIKAMEISGGNATFYGDLSAQGAMLFGSLRIPVALQSFQITNVQDGSNLSYGGNLTNNPNYIIETTGLDALQAGESYDVKLTNQTSTGSTLYAKIITPAGTSTHTTVGQTSGGGSDPEHVADKGNQPDASNGSYTFTINFKALYVQDNPPFYNTDVEFELFVRPNSTGSWLSLGTTPFLDNQSDSGGLKTLNTSIVKQYNNPIGNGGSFEFGATLNGPASGEEILALSVNWTSSSSGSTRTASPNGETCRVTIIPQNL